MLQPGKKTIFIFLLIILAIAAFFRFYKLTEIPPGLYPDVAINANDALSALKTHDFKVFYPENNGREGLFINLIALSFYFFGASVWAIKFVPAIIGILTVLGLYLLTKKLFRQISNFAGDYAELVPFRISKQNLNPNDQILKQSKNSELRNYNLIQNSKWNKFLAGESKIQNFSSSDIIALLSSFFLAISFWHIGFSRLGFRAIMVPFFLVWGFYFLFRAIRIMRINHSNNSNKIYWVLGIGYWVLAGLTFGLGFHTYIAYRVAPLILGVFFLIEIYNFWQRRKIHHYSSSAAPSAGEERSQKAHNTKVLDSSPTTNFARTIILPWLIFFIAVIIAASPMLIYFYNNPQDFMGRTGQVSVLASPQPIKELAISASKSLGMFNIWGDCNWRHNYACEPALPLPIGILFLIGLFWSVATFWNPAFSARGPLRRSSSEASGSLPDSASHWSASLTAQACRARQAGAAGGRWRQENSKLEQSHPKGWTPRQISLFLLVWFFAMLLPAILTNEGLPHSLRAIGAIPPVFIFAGIGGWWILDRIKKFNKIFIFLVVLFCVWLVFYSYDFYFIQWGRNPEVKGAFTQSYVDIGNYLNSLPENTKKYVIVNEGGVPIPYPNGIPMPAQTIMFIEQTSNAKQKAFYLKPEELVNFHGLSPKADYSLVFIPIKYDEGLFNELKNRAPNGKVVNENGVWTFMVNPNDKIQTSNQ